MCIIYTCIYIYRNMYRSQNILNSQDDLQIAHPYFLYFSVHVHNVHLYSVWQFSQNCKMIFMSGMEGHDSKSHVGISDWVNELCLRVREIWEFAISYWNFGLVCLYSKYMYMENWNSCKCIIHVSVIKTCIFSKQAVATLKQLY